MALRIPPLDRLGVEVRGFDFSLPRDGETRREPVATWNAHGAPLRSVVCAGDAALGRVMNEQGRRRGRAHV